MGMSDSESASSAVQGRLIVYGDLACPYSALASYRASWLEVTGRVQVDFRLVASPHRERDREVSGALRHDLQADAGRIHRLLVEGPVFPLRVPARLPDTQVATERYAAQHAQDDRRAREVRVRLFRAVWLRGVDISSGAVLDGLNVAGPGTPPVARQWQREWGEFHDPTVPLVVTSTGERFRGLESLDLLLSLRMRA